MKKAILAALLTACTLPAHAALQNLNCSESPGIGGVQATVDDADLTPPYARVTKANIRIGFATAQLHCSGWGQLNISTQKTSASTEKLSCVGFWFERGEQIVEVNLENKGGQVFASFHGLKGNAPVMRKGGPWACTLTPVKQGASQTDDEVESKTTGGQR
jgi:hypothetical protein